MCKMNSMFFSVRIYALVNFGIKKIWITMMGNINFKVIIIMPLLTSWTEKLTRMGRSEMKEEDKKL